MSAIWRFDRDEVVPEFDPIMAWLRANNVVPENVPLDAEVEFNDDDTMTIDVFLLNENGRKYLVPGTEKAAMGTVTVPLLVPPPPLKSLVAVAVRKANPA